MEKQIINTTHFFHFDRLNSIPILVGSEFDNTLLKPIDYTFSSFNRLLNKSLTPNYTNWINEFVLNEGLVIEHGNEEFISNLNNLKYCYDKIDEKKIVKEIIFENVRRTSYSNKPSRFNSLFLADANQFEYWQKLIKQPDSACTLIKFELLKIIQLVKVYPSFLLIKSDDLVVIEEAAHLYWMEKSNSILPNSLPEYLFVGKAIVIDKVLIEPNK